MPRLGNKYNIGYFFSDQLSCILSDIVGSAELEELKGIQYRWTETMKWEPSHETFSATSTVMLLSSLTGLAMARKASNPKLRKLRRMLNRITENPKLNEDDVEFTL